MLAPELGIPAGMIDKAYNYINKGEKMKTIASNVNKIVQGIRNAPGTVSKTLWIIKNE